MDDPWRMVVRQGTSTVVQVPVGRGQFTKHLLFYEVLNSDLTKLERALVPMVDA